MPTPTLTAEIITAALDGYEIQKASIDTKIAELRAMLSSGTTQTAATPEPTKRKRRKMSAAGRKAISEATKKRGGNEGGSCEIKTCRPKEGRDRR